MTVKHLCLVFLVICIWSLNNVLIKLGLFKIPPLFFATVRFVIVAVLLAPFNRVKYKHIPYILVLSFTFGFLHFSLLFIGMKYTDTGTSSIIIQMGTPISMLLAILFLKERINILQIIGIVTSLIGVVILGMSPTIPSWWVLCLLLCSASGWAISNLIVKMISINPLIITGWTAFFTAPILGLISLNQEGYHIQYFTDTTLYSWLSIFYSAVFSSIIAYSLWYWLLEKYSINMIMPYSLLTPVLSNIMGIYLLGEKMNTFKVYGSILIITGTAIALFKLQFNKNES